MKKSLIWIFLFLVITTAGCKEDEPEIQKQSEPDEETRLKEAVVQVMDLWYLWYDEMPDININQYTTAREVMNALRHPMDPWSSIREEESFDQYYESGQYEGYGLGLTFDANDNLRVRLVYDESAAGRAGIKRSWIVKAINGIPVGNLSGTQLNSELDQPQMALTLIDENGNELEKNLAAGNVGINTVLQDSIYQVGEQKVGYVVFNNFIEPSVGELNEVFSTFQAAGGIDELVLDLRYNGGGRVNVANYLASNILGSQGEGKDFVQYLFNDERAEVNNSAVAFQDAAFNFNLDRLFVIATRSTASASELIINGLRPFIDVVVVGSNTYGKPVGSIGIRRNDEFYSFIPEGYVISPICFRLSNDLGVANYFNGIPADAIAPDDISKPWGDTNEASLNEALYYIQNGGPSTTSRKLIKQPSRTIDYEGLRFEIGAF